MVVKRVSSVKMNVEDENTSFLSRMDDSTLYSEKAGADALLNIRHVKLYDFNVHGKPVNLCFEDKDIEKIFLHMKDRITYLEDKVSIIDKELVNRNKDFLNVTARFAKLISKVHKLNKNFWLRLKFLFTGTKGWVDEFKELNI